MSNANSTDFPGFYPYLPLIGRGAQRLVARVTSVSVMTGVAVKTWFSSEPVVETVRLRTSVESSTTVVGVLNAGDDAWPSMVGVDRLHADAGAFQRLARRKGRIGGGGDVVPIRGDGVEHLPLIGPWCPKARRPRSHRCR